MRKYSKFSANVITDVDILSLGRSHINHEVNYYDRDYRHREHPQWSADRLLAAVSIEEN